VSESLLDALDPGSDEEISLRGEWLSKLMFGWIRGATEDRPYEEWLNAQGFRLV
jgi:hypothetical protein